MRSFSVKNIYAGKKKRNYLFCTRYNSILNPERKILIIKVGLAATAKWYYKLYCQWLFRLSFFLELNLVVLTRRICHTTMLSLGVAWRKTVSDKKCRNKETYQVKDLLLSLPREKISFSSHILVGRGHLQLREFCFLSNSVAGCRQLTISRKCCYFIRFPLFRH